MLIRFVADDVSADAADCSADGSALGGLAVHVVPDDRPADGAQPRAEADATIDSTVPPSGGGFAQFSIFFHAVKPGDVTDNGVVNVDDLLGVINAWGVCQGKSPCPADIAPLGGNGIVNVDDLLKVINNWG